MITIDGVLGMLASAGTEADKATVRKLAMSSGLVWVCGGCGWLNSITDEKCWGDCTVKCTTRPVVHLGSATSVHPDGDTSRTHTLALCGADLGPDYRGLSGNFVTSSSTAYDTVTCAPCRASRAARESRR